MSSLGLILKQGYSQTNNATEVTANVTNNQTLDTASTDLMNPIINQNSDGRLDVQTRLPSNETMQTRNGTLVIGTSNIPITYEQVGSLKILDRDMLLASQIVEGRAAIDRFINAQPWTNSEIPIIIQSDIPNKNRIFDALAYVQATTPITFRPVDIDENGAILNSNYIRFIQASPEDDSCYTFAGMVSPQDALFTENGGIYGDGNYYGQPIVVASWCDTGPLIHELGHVLGLWHEQKRCDRDEYIEIIWSNIEREAWPQYQTLCDPQQPAESPESFGPYDYCSIMHYMRFTGCALDETQPVFNIKQNVVECNENEIGLRSDFSPTDIEAINSVYSFGAIE
jgi:astacin